MTVTVVLEMDALSAAVRRTLTNAVNAIARLAQDQDAVEISRLRQRALDAATSVLHTQGYFSPAVDLEISEEADGEIWHLTIKAGPRTQVSQVDMTFSGAIQAPDFQARRQALQQSWRLPVGRFFVNDGWANAKEALLDELRRKDFFLAQLSRSQATIDADVAQAALALDVDSGPRVRLGALKTEGLRVVPEKLIERTVNYTPGQAFDQEQLEQWQLALNDSGFFRGAFVQLDSDPSHWQTGDDPAPDHIPEVHIPVLVRVVETPRRSLSASLGVDSENGLRIETLYQQNVLFGQAVRSSTGAGLDKNRRRFFHDLHLAPTRQGYRDSVGVLANHSEISGVTNTRLGLGWKRQQARTAAGGSRVEYETRWGWVLAHDNTRIAGVDTYSVPTTVGTWQWLRRNVDNKNDPRDGWLVDAGLGLGATLDKREMFYRASLRAQIWWRVGQHDVLSVRGEAGKVWSRTDRLPEDFSYRTGGVRSLRGYKYQSVGLAQGSAVVGAPALAVFGLEYTHYISDTFGIAAFVDGGDAAPTFKDMNLRWGYGLGARMRTPAGAFGMDVAWAHAVRKLRLYFSLGLAF